MKINNGVYIPIQKEDVDLLFEKEENIFVYNDIKLNSRNDSNWINDSLNLLNISPEKIVRGTLSYVSFIPLKYQNSNITKTFLILNYFSNPNYLDYNITINIYIRKDDVYKNLRIIKKIKNNKIIIDFPFLENEDGVKDETYEIVKIEYIYIDQEHYFKKKYNFYLDFILDFYLNFEAIFTKIPLDQTYTARLGLVDKKQKQKGENFYININPFKTINNIQSDIFNRYNSFKLIDNILTITFDNTDDLNINDQTLNNYINYYINNRLITASLNLIFLINKKTVPLDDPDDSTENTTVTEYYIYYKSKFIKLDIENKDNNDENILIYIRKITAGFDQFKIEFNDLIKLLTLSEPYNPNIQNIITSNDVNYRQIYMNNYIINYNIDSTTIIENKDNGVVIIDDRDEDLIELEDDNNIIDEVPTEAKDNEVIIKVADLTETLYIDTIEF